MSQLVMPDAFTRLHVETYDRRRKQIVPRALSPILVARQAFHGYIRIPELFIDRKRSPRSGVPRVDIRSIQPRVFSDLALARNGMEAPQLLAGPNVEGHQVRLRELHRFRIARVFQRGRDDGDVAEYQRWGGVHQVADGWIEVRVLFNLLGKIDDAFVAERDIRMTGFGVERDQLVARCDRQDLRLTAVGPVRDTAVILADADGAVRRF